MRHEVEHVARRVAVEQSQVVGYAAPPHAIGSGPVHRREIHQQILQRPGRRGRVGQAVHAQSFGGYALTDLGFVRRFGEQFQVGVGVHVDESGAHDITAGVDDTARRHAGDVASHHFQRIARHGHAAPESGRTRTVDYRAIGQQEINHIFAPLGFSPWTNPAITQGNHTLPRHGCPCARGPCLPITGGKRPLIRSLHCVIARSAFQWRRLLDAELGSFGGNTKAWRPADAKTRRHNSYVGLSSTLWERRLP